MKKTITTLLFILASISSVSYAQEESNITIDTLTTRIDRQLQTYPQEKLHVHNDKPYYIAGENVWFRAHLADSYSNRLDSTSFYIYGELFTPSDSMVSRVKIAKMDGIYAGRFKLEEDLPEGTYLMRFYTRYMENMGEESFFKKTISIGAPLSANYNVKSTINYTNDNKKLEVELNISETSTGEQIVPQSLVIGTKNDERKSVNIDKDNPAVSLTFNVDKEPIKTLLVQFEYNGKIHSQYINVPAAENDFNVSFFPEGGSLLSGVPVSLAFKTQTSNGLSEDIKGVVYTTDGDSILSFNSLLLGMGKFPFLGQKDKKYYALCTNDKGISKRFDLPSVIGEGINLKLTVAKDYILAAALSAESMQNPQNLYLIVHAGGHIIHTQQWDIKTEALKVERTQLPTGIIQFLVVDEAMNTISERLAFNLNEAYLPQIEQNNNKQNYSRRERILSKFTLKDSAGEPLNGNFSVAVTDNRDVEIDNSHTILSTLLLSSELRGYIESPASYFSPITKANSTSLDLVMLTHGWRRYNMPEIVKGNMERPTHLIETTNIISGIVKDGILMNKMAKNLPIDLMCTSPFYITSTTSDESGRFAFHGIDVVDSLQLIARATTKKGGDRVEIILDEITYPSFTKGIGTRGNVDRLAFNQYLEKADSKYLIENGMRLIDLKEVEVVARTKPITKGRSAFSSIFNTIIDAEKLKSIGGMTLKDVLSRIGSITVRNGSAFIRANGGAALVLVDGLERDDAIEHEDLDNVEEIEIVKDAGASLWGIKGANGVILITTKRGDGGTLVKKTLYNIAHITPLGFQSPSEFYAPRYETAEQKNDSQPDLRSTILWQPKVNIVNGEASLDFYSADATNTSYSVFVEGISIEGTPIHTIGTIEIGE